MDFLKKDSGMSPRIPQWQSLCLAFVLSLAAGFGCVAFVMGGYSFYDEILDARARRKDVSRFWETLDVLSDGRAVIEQHGPRGLLDREFRDVDRQVIPAPLEAATLHPAELPLQPVRRRTLQRNLRSRVIPLRSGLRAEQWYFLFEDESPGRAWIEGYNLATGDRLGFLGPGGFHQQPPAPAGQFSIDGLALASRSDHVFVTWSDFQNNYGDYNQSNIGFAGDFPIERGEIALLAAGSVFLIDLEERTTQELVSGNDVLSLNVASWLEPLGRERLLADESQFQVRQAFAVRTAAQVLLFSNVGDRDPTAYVLPEEYRDRDIDIFLPAGGLAVIRSFVEDSSRDLGSGRRAFDFDVAWITAAGEVMRRERVTIHAAGGLQHVSERTLMNLATVSCAAPLVSGFAAGVLIPWIDARSHDTPFAASAARFLSAVWPGLVFVMVLGTILAWLADRRQRAYRLPRSFAWLAFVFLLGLPGYIGFLLHRRWPVKAPLSAPQKTGTEIFA